MSSIGSIVASASTPPTSQMPTSIIGKYSTAPRHYAPRNARTKPGNRFSHADSPNGQCAKTPASSNKRTTTTNRNRRNSLGIYLRSLA
eukprot:125691-Pyramimonas_sp.AAC.1